MHTNIQTHELPDRKRDTDRQDNTKALNKVPDFSQRDRETERQRDRETERQKDRKTERQKDTTTQRQKDRKRKIQTNTD